MDTYSIRRKARLRRLRVSPQKAAARDQAISESACRCFGHIGGAPQTTVLLMREYQWSMCLRCNHLASGIRPHIGDYLKHYYQPEYFSAVMERTSPFFAALSA